MSKSGASKALTDALSALSKNQNLEELSVRDICKEAQINRSFFFSYFKDKEDFLNYYFEHIKSNLPDENNCPLNSE